LTGTCAPWKSPIRRLKKGVKLTLELKLKTSEPSRKNIRFSGKKSGKRVRLMRRSSTSVSAKSIL